MVTHRARTLAVVALATVALGLVMLGAGHDTPWVWQLPAWNPRPLPEPTWVISMSQPPADGEPPPQTTPQWLIWLLRVIVALIVLAVAVLLAWWVGRLIKALVTARIERATPPDRPETGRAADGAALTPKEVTDAVAEALARFDAAATPSDAVIAAWLALEEAAGRHGVWRRPSQTPTEFTVELLAHSAVPDADLTTLRRLYWRARFSSLPTSADDAAQARAALEHIARGLEARP